MEVYDDYYYSKEHEWVRFEDDTATVGITAYAQNALGDVTFVEVPKVGSRLNQFDQFSSVESVKAASDIYCPVSGEISEVNSYLEEDPSLINSSCYEDGWIAKIQFTDYEEKNKLMTADEYKSFLESLE